MTETLGEILERRRGISRRTTLLVVAGVVALLAVLAWIVYDPLKGKDQVVHSSDPAFNVLLTPGVVREAKPRGDELMRLRARGRGVRLEVTISPVRIPPYEGDLAGVLPVFTQSHMEELERTIPGFRATGEGKARMHGSPGYQVIFDYGTEERPATGRDVYVLPSEDLGYEPGDRDGVLITYRDMRTRPRLGKAARQVVNNMRSAFRSFQFGEERY